MRSHASHPSLSIFCNTIRLSYHFVEHRFFAKNFPEVDDLVTVEVKKVEDLGAYVTLLEFGEIEGMVPLSELSRRRIRYLL